MRMKLAAVSSIRSYVPPVCVTFDVFSSPPTRERNIGWDARPAGAAQDCATPEAGSPARRADLDPEVGLRLALRCPDSGSVVVPSHHPVRRLVVHRLLIVSTSSRSCRRMFPIPIAPTWSRYRRLQVTTKLDAATVLEAASSS